MKVAAQNNGAAAFLYAIKIACIFICRLSNIPNS